MKKLLFILLSVISLTALAQQKKVAVYVTREQSGVSKVLGDQLVAAFAKSSKFTAIERTMSFLAELGKEQGYQRTGAVNDNEIARLGMQFGVNYVCVADMSDVFGEKYITARLIDVETAEIVNTHNVSGEMSSMSSCIRMASEIAENLSKRTFAEQAKEAEQARIRAAEDARIKEEKEKQEQIVNAKRAKENRLQKLRNEGYVDLGLPSGTWWKINPESTSEYSFSDVSNKINLPTRQQAEELIRYCSFQRNGHGFIAIGPNGNSISFPSTY